MPVSAIDEPTKVIITPDGKKGDPGQDGTDGQGFNQVRKSQLDNPLVWLYKNNDLVSIINGLLTVDRPVGGNYTDIYGVVQAADPDEPREESEGWLVTNDETHTFETRNNIPNPSDGFTAIMEVGTFTGNAVSQTILSVPATTGSNVLFTFGTDALNNFIATIQGSGTVTYTAASTTLSTVSEYTSVIAIYDAGILSIYVNGNQEGTVNLPTGLPADIDVTTESVVTITGDYTANFKGVRFYDFALNADEIEFIS